MTDEDKNIFFNICFNNNFNAYLMKVFLNFFCNCQKYFKVNKVDLALIQSSIIRNNKFFNDTEIIEMIYKSIKKITTYIKNSSPSFNYLLQLRDCVLWCLNNLTEVITQPSEMQEKNSKDNNNSMEQKMGEYTVFCFNSSPFTTIALPLWDTELRF